jgi:hypothetical protein
MARRKYVYGNINAVIDELFEMVIYIRFASELVHFRRVQSQGSEMCAFKERRNTSVDLCFLIILHCRIIYLYYRASKNIDTSLYYFVLHTKITVFRLIFQWRHVFPSFSWKVYFANIMSSRARDVTYSSIMSTFQHSVALYRSMCI